MDQEDIKDFEHGHDLSIKEYSNMSLTDEDKEKALTKIITKEAALLSRMKDSESARENTKQRFELDKKTRTQQHRLSKEQLDLEIQKHNLDKVRFGLENERLALEKAKYEDSKKERKFDRVLKCMEIGFPVVTAVCGLVISVVTIRAQVKATNQMLYLSYAQEGRVIPEYKDQLRNLNTLVNKGIK